MKDMSGGHINMQESNVYVNITSATTTQIMLVPGFLHLITVNTPGAGAITIYDSPNASGTKIGTIANSPAIGSQFLYDVQLKNGLTIVTGATMDITVSCVDNS